MAEQPDEDLFIASPTIAEIHRGELKKPPGPTQRSMILTQGAI